MHMAILRPLDLVILASRLRRDTLDNIRQTGEFVVNVPTVDMLEEVMVCARNYPPEVDEFEMAKLEAKASSKVKAPGINGCLAWMECTLEEEILRDQYALIIGKVVHLEADDRFFNEGGEMNPSLARPLSRLHWGISLMPFNPACKKRNDHCKFSENRVKIWMKT
jgi:flavin reductase (DIM6/NTAB) family NADH-FMN oxidoreductase RutF